MSSTDTGQIRFFKKSKLDISNVQASITVTDPTATNNGQTFVDFLRNRNNVSAWLTTGSNDAAKTVLEFNLTEERDVDSVLFILHNFKGYTLKYWDGSAYVDFSTPINVTGNTAKTTFHEFPTVTTSALQLVITGTFVADADKKMRQVIITEKLISGQLEGWPVIRKPRHTTNKKVSSMLSGKVNVVESVGGFEADLSVRNWNKDADLEIVEEIYLGKRGVLMWLSGGKESQFGQQRIGYRDEDIYLVRAINDYSPEWVSGVYRNGLRILMRLREAIG
ncbi:MAG: hypothetical protein GY861_17845 [bacterium]|nr:hypothetical protein [bacterium]